MGIFCLAKEQIASYGLCSTKLVNELSYLVRLHVLHFTFILNGPSMTVKSKFQCIYFILYQ